MASKRGLLSFIFVVSLLSSCALVRVKKSGSESSFYDESFDFASNGCSSCGNVKSGGLKTSSFISSNARPSVKWDVFSVHEEDGESKYEIRKNNITSDNTLAIMANSYVETSDGFREKSGGYVDDGFIKVGVNDGWMEYRFTLSESSVGDFNNKPLVIFGGVEETLLSSGDYAPSSCEISINGELQEITDTRSYREMGVEYRDYLTLIHWYPGIKARFVEGLNTIRYTRKSSGNLFIKEFLITDYPFEIQEPFEMQES